jgi:putative membrane protein
MTELLGTCAFFILIAPGIVICHLRVHMLTVRRMMLGLSILGLLRANVAAAQERPWDWGTHPMMWGWGAWGIGMMVMMVVFWALVIAGLVLTIRWLVRQGDEPRGEMRVDRALQILRVRYARGEIGKEEFEARKRDLT